MTWARVSAWLRSRWWLVFNCGLLAIAAVAIQVNREDPPWVSETSYVVRASVDDPDELIRATTTLAANDTIASTYAQIATSDAIGDPARRRLGLDAGGGPPLDLTGSVVPGTNAIVIGARSPDRDIALQAAVVASELTERYVADLGGVFVLAPLDPPTLERESGLFRDGRRRTMAAAVGMLVGAVLAAGVQRVLPPPPQRRMIRNVHDDRLPIHSPQYLRARLDEEIVRNGETGQPFSIGTLDVVRGRGHTPDEDEPTALSDQDLVLVIDAIGHLVREQDIIAHVGRGRLVALLPDMDVERARDHMRTWRTSVAQAILRKYGELDLRVRTSAATYDPPVFSGDLEAELIASEL